jgi:hypothetical protein
MHLALLAAAKAEETYGSSAWRQRDAHVLALGEACRPERVKCSLRFTILDMWPTVPKQASQSIASSEVNSSRAKPTTG